MRLLFLLFVFVFSIHAIDTDLNDGKALKDDKACPKSMPSLHGSYKDKDGLVWTCSQTGNEFTFRAGASKEGKGKFQLNDECVWNAEIQWTSGGSGTTKVKLVFNEDKDVKIKSKDDDKVWTRFERGPKLLGFWKDSYGKDWRCIQPYSIVYCWDQRGRESRSLLERLKATDDWTATVNYIGETTPNTQLTVKSEKQITFATGDIWNRLECEYNWKCNTDMPNVEGSYKDQSGQLWKISQTGAKVTLKSDTKTLKGLLRQRPNRCFWGILVDGLRKGLESTEYVEISVRPNALFVTVLNPPDFFGDVVDKWKTTATRLEEENTAAVVEGTLLVRN